MTGGAFSETASAFLARCPTPIVEKPLDLDRLGHLLDAVSLPERRRSA